MTSAQVAYMADIYRANPTPSVRSEFGKLIAETGQGQYRRGLRFDRVRWQVSGLQCICCSLFTIF